MTRVGVGKASKEQMARNHERSQQNARDREERKADNTRERQKAKERAQESRRVRSSEYKTADGKPDHAAYNKAVRDKGEANMQARRDRNQRKQQHKKTAAQWGLDTSRGVSPRASRYINEGGDQLSSQHYQKKALAKIQKEQGMRDANDRMNAANMADPDKNATAEDYEAYKSNKSHWSDSATSAYTNYMNHMMGGGKKKNGQGQYYNPYNNSFS